MNGRWDPYYAWTLPYVTGHAYKWHIGKVGLDYTNVTIQLSELWRSGDIAGEEADKPIHLVHNFSDVRAAFEFRAITWKYDAVRKRNYEVENYFPCTNESSSDPTLINCFNNSVPTGFKAFYDETKLFMRDDRAQIGQHIIYNETDHLPARSN